jgi:hypothetical protein
VRALGVPLGWEDAKGSVSPSRPNKALKTIQGCRRTINGGGFGDVDISSLPAVSMQCTFLQIHS